jgi:hypothetical protein
MPFLLHPRYLDFVNSVFSIFLSNSLLGREPADFIIEFVVMIDLETLR